MLSLLMKFFCFCSRRQSISHHDFDIRTINHKRHPAASKPNNVAFRQTRERKKNHFEEKASSRDNHTRFRTLFREINSQTRSQNIKLKINPRALFRRRTGAISVETPTNTQTRLVASLRSPRFRRQLPRRMASAASINHISNDQSHDRIQTKRGLTILHYKGRVYFRVTRSNTKLKIVGDPIKREKND